MELNNLLKEKRQEILSLAARHGATNVRVFGSAARGEADTASDPDVLVDLEPGGACWTWAACSWICNSFWSGKL
jgi:predicted nucleotidyltransferase